MSVPQLATTQSAFMKTIKVSLNNNIYNIQHAFYPIQGKQSLIKAQQNNIKNEKIHTIKEIKDVRDVPG